MLLSRRAWRWTRFGADCAFSAPDRASVALTSAASERDGSRMSGVPALGFEEESESEGESSYGMSVGLAFVSEPSSGVRCVIERLWKCTVRPWRTGLFGIFSET